MNKICRVFFFIFFISTIFSGDLFSQDKPHIAVIPFKAIGIPETESMVISGLFETALVKTGVYSVIEQNQMDDVLEAQAFSLSGCTDESCAVEIGKLLAAELIVLGEVSKVGVRYIANAKIIDVGLGKNIRADSVSVDSIEEMTDRGVTLLAYKLAGLTYVSASQEKIAEAFGEIFVTTEPAGAEIYINGFKRGVSPLVIDQVPLGEVIVTARKGSYLGEKTIILESPELFEVSMNLEITTGNLFIRSSESEMTVYLDGVKLGRLGTGLFKGLSSGEHNLRLRGDGLLWEGAVTIEADKTASVEAYPHPFGYLRYSLPEGAFAELTGGTVNKTLSGSGVMELTAGSYSCTVRGDMYKDAAADILIERNGTFEFQPELAYTEEYLAKQQDNTVQEEEYAALRTDLDTLALKCEEFEGGPAETLLSEVDSYRQRITEPVHEFPDILSRLNDLEKNVLDTRLDELHTVLARYERSYKTRNALRWTGFAAGAAGFALSGVYKYIGDTEYELYLAAGTTPESSASHRLLDTYMTIQTAGLITGGVGAAAGIVLSFGAKNPDDIQSEITELSMRKASLQGGIQ